MIFIASPRILLVVNLHKGIKKMSIIIIFPWPKPQHKNISYGCKQTSLGGWGCVAIYYHIGSWPWGVILSWCNWWWWKLFEWRGWECFRRGGCENRCDCFRNRRYVGVASGCEAHFSFVVYVKKSFFSHKVI